jgi:hypothetical protein
MATFTHQFGSYNVTNSINHFIRTNLGLSVPKWMTWNYGVTEPRTLNFYWPDQPLNFPSFSVTHHASDPVMSFEGDRADGTYRGIRRQGSMEINCWVLEIILNKDGSQTKNTQWMLQLQTMRDMVFKLLEQNRFIPLYDCSDPLNLVALNAVVTIKDIRETTLVPDPNPAVKRIRILATYRWTERF